MTSTTQGPSFELELGANRDDAGTRTGTDAGHATADPCHAAARATHHDAAPRRRRSRPPRPVAEGMATSGIATARAARAASATAATVRTRRPLGAWAVVGATTVLAPRVGARSLPLRAGRGTPW